MAIPVELINKGAYNLVKTAEGVAELTSTMTDYLRTQIREDSFARKILPPEVKAVEETQRDPSGKNGLLIIEEKEPENGDAVILDLRGEPDTEYISSELYTVKFFTISTPLFALNVNDLLSRKSPITSIVRTNAEKDMAKKEDSAFMALTKAALSKSGNVKSISGTSTINKQVITEGLKLLTKKKLEGSVILMSKNVFYDIQAWDQSAFGNGDMLGQVVINGFTYPTLLGVKYVTTIKTDVLGDDADNSLWIYTDPAYLGKHYKLGGDLTFMMEKRFDRLEFKSSQIMGMSFGNSNAVAKVTWSA